MKKHSGNPPPREGHRGRRSYPPQGRTLRNANSTINTGPGGPPPPAPVNLAARNEPFSHIRIVPKPPVELDSEQRMQSTNPFTFKKVSFSEEAEAKLSSNPNSYNWQANLANGSDGSSFAQKARAAELNAARARKAAQMQSIDDEIPDLSGPISLGMYKFIRRGRGKKYETHRLTELQNVRDKEGEKKVTVAAPTSSVHPALDLVPPTTLSPSQLSEHPCHQSKAALSDSILDHSDNLSLDERGFHEPGSCQSGEPGLIYSATDFPELVSSSYSKQQSFEPSGQAETSSPSGQGHPSFQDSFNRLTPSSRASEQLNSLSSPEYHRSHLGLPTTVETERLSSHPGFAQADYSARLEDYTSDQIFNAWTDSNRQGPQASEQSHPPLPPPDRHLNSSQKYSQLVKSLNALVKSSGRSSKASAQAPDRLPTQDFQRFISKLYRKRVGKTEELLEPHREVSGASSQPQHSAASKDYGSPESLPLSDTLPTASFNLETNKWDPDLPEANMSAQTPTNKSMLGSNTGHYSSGKSSSQASHASQDVRNPYAIVTTTKSGRPYTNPYMPIYPPPSAARQTVKVLSQSEDAELIERQRKTGYGDQEKARHGVLDRAEQGHVKDELDDPFQDQITHAQKTHGRDQVVQSFNYSEYSASQAPHGQSPSYHYQPTATTYVTDPHASPFFSNEQKAQHGPDNGISPFSGRYYAYEPPSGVNSRAQIPGITTHEQRAGQERANPRASVRLPAVKGTTEQHKHILNVGSLSLEDSVPMNAQGPLGRQLQSVAIQPASSKVSHAVPIRDPAAYTGSGLTSRRNQDALRQNLDTVVASSQASTGAARTVMNDPHRDRQPSGRPSSTATDTTVTGSTLRAQAPSYEFVNVTRPETIDQPVVKPRQATTQRHGTAALEGTDSRSSHAHTSYASKSFERDAPDPGLMYHLGNYRSPAVPPGLGYDAIAMTKNAGLPNQAIGAGNAFMNELKAQIPPKQNSQQRLEDSQRWFRHDSRDLSYAAAVLPHDTMNIMNPERFPIEDGTPRSVSLLTNDSQDDGPIDRARDAATPRPIGHGRPAGFATPSRSHVSRRVSSQTPSSTPAGVSSASDNQATRRSARDFLHHDAQAMEAMFGGVFENLMSGKNGPYDYMNHYSVPPAYSIDHNARNNHTLFDPQWFATAPPARVGRDPRREQGEYEDPTQGIASRGRGEAIRRDSSGRGGGGVRGWGRN